LGVVVRSFKAAVTRELCMRDLPDLEAVWQPNFYDRVVRDEAKLARIREYIAYNPVAWQYDTENPERTADEPYERAWGWLENGRYGP
jgi:putative transposase